MSELLDLYQEIIIDHSRAPKNFGVLKNRTHRGFGNNPLCGDALTVDLEIKNNVITNIKFNGDGCAISKASASLMTEELIGANLEGAHKLFKRFHTMLTCDDGHDEGLGKLSVLSGVKQFPMRVKCATLCWHTFEAALKNESSSVTTE